MQKNNKFQVPWTTQDEDVSYSVPDIQKYVSIS